VAKPIAIYTCYNVRYPVGGHVLAELHYIVGLQRLGYEVILIEESGMEWAPCFDPVRHEMTQDPSYGLAAQREWLRPLGLEHNWCYVDSARQYHGISAADFRQLCRRATVLFSRAGVNWLPEFAECRTRVFVDVDPGRVQFKMKPRSEAPPSCSGYASPYDFHYHFTCGHSIGRPDSPVPTHGLTWRPTRHPVALELVPCRFTPEARYFTTVMSWRSHPPLVYRGEAYGQKDVEFRKILHLPRRVGEIFEIAVAGGDVPRAELQAAGWRLARAVDVTLSVDRYLAYITGSRGEFSVAANLSVKARTGVITDRAVAYLAAGKPVVLEETGFSDTLPVGEGLFAFRDEEEAAAAIEKIQTDYPRHCRAARQLAEEYFAAEKVLGELFRQCDLPVPNCRAQSLA